MFHKFQKFQKIKHSDSKIPRTQNGDTDPECRIRAVARSLIGRFLISKKKQVEFLYSWPIYGLSLAFSVSNNSNNSKKWGYLLWPFTSLKKIWPYTRKYRAFVVVLVAFSGTITGIISNKNQVEFPYSWPIYGPSLAFKVSNNSNNSNKWGYLLWPFASFEKIWAYTRKYHAIVYIKGAVLSRFCLSQVQ